MTTTDSTSGPDHSQPPPGRRSGRPLYRSRDDRVVAGVAAGVGYWLDVDPVLIRVLLAVLTLFGGVGLLLYAIGWLFIPEVDDSASIAEGWLAGRRPLRPTGLTLVGVVAAAVVLGIVLVQHVHAIAILAAVAVVAALATRAGHRPAYGGPPGGARFSAGSPVAPTAPGAPGAPVAEHPTIPLGDPLEHPTVPVGEPGAWAASEPRRTSYRPAVRQRRRSTSRLVLGAAVLAAGFALLVDHATGVHLTVTQLLAIPLAVLGAALAVTAVLGRSWLAIVAGVGLTAAVLAGVALHGHFGSGREVTWAPTSADLAARYHLDVGKARLDLRHADLPGRHVRADVGVGELVVVVPPGTPVRVRGNAGIGALDLFGDHDGGFGARHTFTEDGYTDQTGGELDLHVGVGHVEVTHG
jgi:phage shock protein PspC (stress-responsive transcriptional regulator)